MGGWRSRRRPGRTAADLGREMGAGRAAAETPRPDAASGGDGPAPWVTKNDWIYYYFFIKQGTRVCIPQARIIYIYITPTPTPTHHAVYNTTTVYPELRQALPNGDLGPTSFAYVLLLARVRLVLYELLLLESMCILLLKIILL